MYANKAKAPDLSGLEPLELKIYKQACKKLERAVIQEQKYPKWYKHPCSFVLRKAYKQVTGMDPIVKLEPIHDHPRNLAIEGYKSMSPKLLKLLHIERGNILLAKQLAAKSVKVEPLTRGIPKGLTMEQVNDLLQEIGYERRWVLNFD